MGALVGLRFLVHRDRLLVHGASLDDPLERVAFVIHVAFADVEQLGQFVVPLLEHDIDVGPGFVDIVLQRHKTVIDCRGVPQKSDRDESHTQQDHSIHQNPQSPFYSRLSIAKRRTALYSKPK